MTVENAQRGWRLALGWILVAATGYQFLLRPLATWVFQAFGWAIPALPSFEVPELVSMLSGILGLSTLRTYEKFKGVTR